MSVTHKRIQTERKLETKCFAIYHARHDSVLPVVFSWLKVYFHFTVHAYTKNMFSAHRNNHNVWASRDNADDSETHWPTITMTDISTASHRYCFSRLHHHTATIGMVQRQWKRFHCNRNARTFFRVVSVKVNVQAAITGCEFCSAIFLRWPLKFHHPGEVKRQFQQPMWPLQTTNSTCSLVTEKRDDNNVNENVSWKHKRTKTAAAHVDPSHDADNNMKKKKINKVGGVVWKLSEKAQ